MHRVLFSTCLFKATEIAVYVNTHRYKLALTATETLREMLREIPQAPEFERTASPVAAVHALVMQGESGSVGGMTLQAAELHSLLERIVQNGREMAVEAREATLLDSSPCLAEVNARRGFPEEADLLERAGVTG